MFNKTACITLSLCLYSLCFAADSLPDPNDWFIQPLGWNAMYQEDLKVSDTYVLWQADYGLNGGAYVYDGTGIYSPGYVSASISGNSLVYKTIGGIQFIRSDVNKVIPFDQGNIYDIDVFENTVVWQAGPDRIMGEIYYYSDDYPDLGVFLLADDAKTPKVSANGIAWLGYDGNDFEVFLLKDQTVVQLTNNSIDESNLSMSDDGQLAWMTWHSDHEYLGYVHYYDGQRTRQVTVGSTFSRLCGISEEGVLYVAEHHPGYDPDFENVLLHHEGNEETLIAGGRYTYFPTAAIGGGSIAWIEIDFMNQQHSVNYLKGEELVRWPISDDFWDEYAMIGVWGDRIVWTPNYEDLYFGEHLRRNCVAPPRMDTNDDCQVNLADFVVFASEWLLCGYADQNDCL